jgi:hypothetical protein
VHSQDTVGIYSKWQKECRSTKEGTERPIPMQMDTSQNLAYTMLLLITLSSPRKILLYGVSQSVSSDLSATVVT